MRLTIKARSEVLTPDGYKKPEFRFWMPQGGGYVRLESDGKSGTLGQQICEGGSLSGSTISATEENFCAVCRSWYRAYMRAAKK